VGWECLLAEHGLDLNREWELEYREAVMEKVKQEMRLE
jgi:hypothetical protein